MQQRIAAARLNQGSLQDIQQYRDPLRDIPIVDIEVFNAIYDNTDIKNIISNDLYISNNYIQYPIHEHDDNSNIQITNLMQVLWRKDKPVIVAPQEQIQIKEMDNYVSFIRSLISVKQVVNNPEYLSQLDAILNKNITVKFIENDNDIQNIRFAVPIDVNGLTRIFYNKLNNDFTELYSPINPFYIYDININNEKNYNDILGNDYIMFILITLYNAKTSVGLDKKMSLYNFFIIYLNLIDDYNNIINKLKNHKIEILDNTSNDKKIIKISIYYLFIDFIKRLFNHGKNNARDDLYNSICTDINNNLEIERTHYLFMLFCHQIDTGNYQLLNPVKISGYVQLFDFTTDDYDRRDVTYSLEEIKTDVVNRVWHKSLIDLIKNQYFRNMCPLQIYNHFHFRTQITYSYFMEKLDLSRLDNYSSGVKFLYTYIFKKYSDILEYDYVDVDSNIYKNYLKNFSIDDFIRKIHIYIRGDDVLISNNDKLVLVPEFFVPNHANRQYNSHTCFGKLDINRDMLETQLTRFNINVNSFITITENEFENIPNINDVLIFFINGLYTSAIGNSDGANEAG
jgi:hypothetical protein